MNDESQVDGNSQIDIKSQIKPNQIKAQLEAQKEVTSTVDPKVRRGVSL